MIFEYTTQLEKRQSERPAAQALVRGGTAYPDITGLVTFYPRKAGVLVVAEFTGLPGLAAPCSRRVFALHIHEGTACTGTPTFADAKGHYNPAGCAHPQHAGDLPPVFANDGSSWQALITNRFAVEDIIGHTVILHGGVDDFTGQPAGNAGERIACGIIRTV